MGGVFLPSKSRSWAWSSRWWWCEACVKRASAPDGRWCAKRARPPWLFSPIFERGGRGDARFRVALGVHGLSQNGLSQNGLSQNGLSQNGYGARERVREREREKERDTQTMGSPGVRLNLVIGWSNNRFNSLHFSDPISADPICTSPNSCSRAQILERVAARSSGFRV